MSSVTPPRPRKKNAASQFRSRGKTKRISHPLLDSPSTPPRKSSSSGNDRRTAPVTPEPPGLLNALEMAARPSNKVNNTGKDKNGSGSAADDAPQSYISSLEAMAAHVEASHNTRPKPIKKTTPTSPLRMRRNSNSNGSLSSRSSGGGKRKRKPSSSSGKPVRKVSPISKFWLIAIPIFLSFLIFESFLWLLVYRFNDHALSTGGEVLLSIPIITQDVVRRNDTVESVTQEVEEEGKEAQDDISQDGIVTRQEEVSNDDSQIKVESVSRESKAVEDEEARNDTSRDGMAQEEKEINDDSQTTVNDMDSNIVEEVVEEEKKGSDDETGGIDETSSTIETQSEERDAEKSSDIEMQSKESQVEVPPKESGTESKLDDELTKLQSMLQDGFAKLRAPSKESDETLNRELVESLCGQVWEISNDLMLSPESQNIDDSSGTTLDKMSQSDDDDTINPYASLALNSQHCLGGAGLAFLAKDVDVDRLQVSRKVFDRLSFVDPHNPDVRAGLGTSLLIQGIFNDDSIGKEAGDESQRYLLTLATYHLNLASSLCSATIQASLGAESLTGSEVNKDGEMDMDTVAISKPTNAVEDDNNATLAAILHNLAIAYIALGDNKNSIPILLRAAALRREQRATDAKPYWNVPHHVLQLAEEKALLIAAKTKKPEKVAKKERIPFFH